MTTAATRASMLLVLLKDPTGRKRAQARRRLMLVVGSASAGVMIGVATALVERRRRRLGVAAQERAGWAVHGVPRPAVAPDQAGHLRSRHGQGAAAGAGTNTGPIPMGSRSPLDTLAASAQRLQAAADEEPGWNAHLGFGVGGTIPAEVLMTGAGEAMTNSTTSGSSAAHGPIH
ncbi:MAG: hypothetical protein JHD16_09170 [Solirubrobacteraceae bacterium]|nr:hypothetical protein [Solirubrobacteraceae bacterium]